MENRVGEFREFRPGPPGTRPAVLVYLRFLIAEIFNNEKCRTNQDDPNADVDIDIGGIGNHAAWSVIYG